MTTPEGAVKKDIDKLLKELACYVDTRTSRGFGRVGIPDRTGCYRGLYFGIEAKPLDTDEPDPWQVREMRHITEAGGFSICVGAPSHCQVLYGFFTKLDQLADALDKLRA